MNRIRLAVITTLLLAFLVVVSPGSGSRAQEFKVGFIYVGPVQDAGWTFQHDQARKYVEAHVPDATTIKLESVPEANAGAAIDQLVGQGAKMIFATSFGFGPAVVQKAPQYPNVLFEHATGFQRAQNISTYFVDHTQGSYLLGMLAGRMTKTNVLGYVGSFPISEVIRDINAYTLGAQSVNPKAKVKVVLISTWVDPLKETQAARSLLDARADVLFGIEDTPSVLQAAAKAGKFASTWNSNMNRFGPKAFLSANVLTWGPYYAREVRKAIAGTWRSQDFWGSLREGSLKLAPYGTSVPRSLRALVNTRLAGFKKRTFNPFKGPIRDQSGKVRVPRGKTMTFTQIVNWNWYVRGVQGKLPG